MAKHNSQFLDPPQGALQLAGQHHNQLDQPVAVDPPRANIVLELLDVHARIIIHLADSGSASFREWTATVKDGASKRAESQVRKLNREDIANGGSGGYSSEIRKDGFPSSSDALDYEKRWRDTYRRLFGQDKLPGNREHLRGRGGL